MTVELSVLVPCFNEEGNLPELVERTERVFERRGIAGEIVLVNDGSIDATGAQVDHLAATHPRVVGVHHPVNRGMTAAWQTALEHARGAYVLTIDADLQYQPEAIAQLWREMRFSNADVVQGWRSPLERQRDDIRYYMSHGLDVLLRFTFEMPHKDIKSGFCLYKRDVFADILQHAPRYHYFQTFVTVAARAKGYSVRQVETLFLPRKAGTSFISRFPFGIMVRTIADVGRGVREFRFGQPKEQALALALARTPEPPRARDAAWRRRSYRAYSALMPVHHWAISRNAPRYLEELRRTQWLPRAEIETLQLGRLQRLVRHAWEHTPYYREAFQQAGITPEDIRSLDDLRRVPVLTKALLRDNLYFDLLADNHDKRRIQKIATSGSTGEPLALYADRFQLEMRWANTWRNVEWTGYRWPDPQVRLWRGTIGMTPLQTFKEHLDGWLSGRAFFSVFALDGAALDRYVQHVRRTKPALLDGYTEAFNVIANLIAARSVDGIEVGAIISSAQTLSPETRALIEAQFRCRVFDEYGSREFSGLAHECEAHAGYHVNAESYIVEVMRDGRPAAPGEVGEVLVTDLNNRVVPLIRYRLGDLAVATDRVCACGRGLPMIDRVIGRAQSVVLGTNGRYVPGTYFAHLFKEYEYAVTRYQVVQEERDRILVNLVRRSRFTAQTEAELRRALADVLGRDMRMEFRFVDAMPPVRTGQAQAVVCRIPLPLFSAEAADRWEEVEREAAG